jgi:Conjugal transfer protein TraD
MSSYSQLSQQIERSAERLAHLKARQMIKHQRDALRTREAQRRADTKQKFELGTMLVDAGIAKMEPAEILGALLVDPVNRERYTTRGANWLAAQKPSRILS